MGRIVVVIMIVTMAHELSSYEGGGLPNVVAAERAWNFTNVPRSIYIEYPLRFHLALCVSLKIWARIVTLSGKDNAMTFFN